MPDPSIGDPRPAGEEGPAGDQRPTGSTDPAGDPRPAGAETVEPRADEPSSDNTANESDAKPKRRAKRKD